jgi:MFS family permease
VPSTRAALPRGFGPFWLGQTVSVLGDAFSLIALPLLVLEATGSVAHMGFVTGAAAASQLVALTMAGALVERSGRLTLMMACDLGRAVVLFAIVAAWWTLGPRTELVYAAAVANALLGSAHRVASTEVVTSLVGRDRVIDANARLQGSLAASFALGPMLAGLVAQAGGAAAAVLVDAASFVVSAAALAVVRAVAPLRSEPASGVTLGDALRFIRGDPFLRVGAAFLATLAAIGAATLQLLIFHLKVDLRCTDTRLGILFAVSSVGAIAGAVAAPTVRRRLGLGRAITVGAIIDAAGTVSAGLAGGTGGIAASATVWAMGSRVRDVALISMRQERVPDRLLGRVSAAYWAIMTVAAPLGASLAGMIAERIGVRAVLVGSGVLAAVPTLVVRTTALGKARA